MGITLTKFQLKAVSISEIISGLPPPGLLDPQKSGANRVKS